MACVRGKQAVEPDEVTVRAWDQRGETGDKVERLEQHMGGAIAKRVLELIDHQPIAVAAEPYDHVNDRRIMHRTTIVGDERPA